MMATRGARASEHVMLMPRLRESAAALREAACAVQARADALRRANSSAGGGPGAGGVEAERRAAFCAGALGEAARRVERVSDIAGILGALPCVIHVVRTVSASLICEMPECSRRLSEAAVQAGSVALDSASLRGARFDFGRSNRESAALLDGIKLTVDSKLSRQYPDVRPPGRVAA